MPDEAGLIGAVSLFKPRRIKHLVVARDDGARCAHMPHALPLKSEFETKISLTKNQRFGSHRGGQHGTQHVLLRKAAFLPPLIE